VGNASYKKTIPVFVLSFIIWFLYVGNGSYQEVIAGLLAAALVSVAVYPFCLKKDFYSVLLPRRLIFFLWFIPVFAWEMIKANVDLACRTLHPRLPINPGIVKIPTDIKSDLGVTMLANSITLTPGTITVDVDARDDGNMLYIHWINVASKNQEEARQKIDGVFEGLIRRIFP